MARATLWRCYLCRKGLIDMTRAVRCTRCLCRRMVPIPPGGLSWLDRVRLVHQLGLPPWTRHVPDAELYP